MTERHTHTVTLTETEWATICTALTVTILNMELGTPKSIMEELRSTLGAVQRGLGLEEQSPEELEQERQQRGREGRLPC